MKGGKLRTKLVSTVACTRSITGIKQKRSAF